MIVSDQGKGIAAEELEQIFGKFYQVEEATTREQGGTGLGLAICRGIIEAHRGEIWAESELGHGSSFHFTLACWVDASGRDPRDTRVSVPSLLSSLRSEGTRPTRSRRLTPAGAARTLRAGGFGGYPHSERRSRLGWRSSIGRASHL